MTFDAAARVREFLLASDFTTDGVLVRVGAEAFAALGRDLAVPVRRALEASDTRRPDPAAPGARDGSDPSPRDPSGPSPLDPSAPGTHDGSSASLQDLSRPSPLDPSRPNPADSSPLDPAEPLNPNSSDPPSRLRSGPTPSGPRPLDRLIEAFLLADPIPDDALPGQVVEDRIALGMVRREGNRLIPLVDVHPYGEPDTDWFIVSDIGAPATPDHVLGLGGASLTLARITPRRDVGRVMDLGCGAGGQVLHASRHASRVVATDTNPRALALTALTAALSGIPEEQVDLREGSLFAPVSDERFDLVLSNPPFVISPSHRFTYRDAGLPGDELSRLVVRGAAAHLAPGGMAAVLGNWLHVAGEDWRERVAEWVSGTGVDAWIVERDAQSVADYSATWLRDAQVPDGPEFDAAMDEWLDAFADEGCVEVGFGWFILVAPGSGASVPPWVLVEDLAHIERLPRGDEVLAFLEGCRTAEQATAPGLLAAHARLVEGVTITTTHLVGPSPVDAPPRLGLAGVVGPGGWRPAITVPPTLLSALLADPDTPIGERLDAAAQAEGLDPLDVLGPALMGLRELVRVGIVRTE